MRCTTRQPNGCVLSGTTQLKKLSSSAEMRAVGTHSMIFWITWLPFCEATQHARAAQSRAVDRGPGPRRRRAFLQGRRSDGAAHLVAHASHDVSVQLGEQRHLGVGREHFERLLDDAAPVHLK